MSDNDAYIDKLLSVVERAITAIGETKTEIQLFRSESEKALEKNDLVHADLQALLKTFAERSVKTMDTTEQSLNAIAEQVDAIDGYVANRMDSFSDCHDTNRQRWTEHNAATKSIGETLARLESRDEGTRRLIYIAMTLVFVATSTIAIVLKYLVP